MFMQVDKSYKDIMRKVNKVPSAIRAGTQPGMLFDLDFSPFLALLVYYENFLTKLRCLCRMTDRIFHRSPMQTEKSLLEGKRIIPEMRFTEYLALSVYPRVGISQFASETDV